MTIEKLTDRHHGMMKDTIFNHFTPSEIKDKYDITLSRFSIIQKSPFWKAKADEMRKVRDEMEVQALEADIGKINGMRRRAIGKLDECMESDNENIKFASAKDILNRTNLTGESEDKNQFKAVLNLYIPPKWKGVEEEEVIEIEAIP